jgi:GT2 family glycosyltransferase
MPQRMPLSVVVPTRDTRELTLACLASLAPLGAEETILVDDGSSDGTRAAVAAAFPGVQILGEETPRGFAQAANRGLDAARGELFLLLNSDTEWLAGTAAGLAAAFAREPRLGAAGARLENPDGSAQWSGGAQPGLAWLFALASGLPAALGRSTRWRRLRPVSGAAAGAVDWLPGAALVLRREAWRRAGPLDEGYRFYAQDLDLASRLRAAGWRLAVLDELRFRHHLGGTIGTTAGAASSRRLDLLYTDLLRWAERWRGARFARRARRALAAGSALRAAVLAGAAAPAGRRSALEAERTALAAARRALAAAGAARAAGARASGRSRPLP